MASNIVSAVHNIRIAKEQFLDFIREHPASKGSKLFEQLLLRLMTI